MKIQSIVIKNFRSLRSVEIDVGSFNVLIGKNNHGKSNFFEAVEWFYSGKGDLAQIKHCDAESEDVIEVQLKLSVSEEDIENISNEDNRTKIRKAIGENGCMHVRRVSTNARNREILGTDDKWKKQPTGADSAFNNCMPRFEFVEATKNLKEVSAFKSTTPIGQMLSGVLEEVLEKDEEYANFHKQFERLFQSETSKVRTTLNDLSSKVQKHLKQQFPDCDKVTFDVVEPSFDDFLKNYNTNLDDGVDTRAEDKGDGMQRALMLAIIKTHADYRREEALGRSFIFFIDEAELHLHPTGQRQLKQALLELTSGVDQVFITTHSSVFIADEQVGQTTFKVEKAEKSTGIFPIGHTERLEVVYDLLGGSPADLLFPHNFMIVEGHSDSLFLKKVCQRLYPHKPEILFLAAGGDTSAQSKSMDAINRALLPLHVKPIYKERLGILCDKPTAVKQAEYDKFKQTFPYLETNGQLFTLEVGSIEEAYPSQWTKTEDEVEAMDHNDKRKLAQAAGDNITLEQFEQEMPLVKAALEFVWGKAY